MRREGWIGRSRRWAAGAGGVALAASGLALAWGWSFGRGLALAGACWLFGAAVACGAWRRAAARLPAAPGDAPAALAGAVALVAGLAGVANGYWLLFAAGAPLGLSAAGVALLAEQYWLGPVALAAAGIGWGLFRHALRGEGG